MIPTYIFSLISSAPRIARQDRPKLVSQHTRDLDFYHASKKSASRFIRPWTSPTASPGKTLASASPNPYSQKRELKCTRRKEIYLKHENGLPIVVLKPSYVKYLEAFDKNPRTQSSITPGRF